MKADSIWTLQVDLLSARALVWIAAVGREAELSREAHQYFSDRYQRLAGCYRRRGRLQAAAKAEAMAKDHGGDDGPPFEAAMAMPRPSHWIRTWAVGGRNDPDDAA